MKNYFRTILAVLVLAGAALAQYPTNPNPAGKQTTPYANNVFSATFNGAVTQATHAENTSTETMYASVADNIYQIVTVRYVDHDIAVDYTSSDFYVSNQTGCDSKTALSKDSWGGHPFSYDMCVYTENGVAWSVRSRFIIVNSKEVIFIQQHSLNTVDDQNIWFDFEYSLRIN